MKKLFTYAICSALSCSVSADLLAQQRQHQCGTTHQDQTLLKQRMMENRRNEAQIFQEYQLRKSQRNSNDTIYYVPIMFHITGDQQGNGYVPIDRVLGTLCRLNDDYRDQKIQFYIYGIQYINNSFIYNHGNTSGDGMAVYFMSLYRQPNVVNIFIGRDVSPQDAFLAYYTRAIDIIYSFKTGIGPGNPTITHEMGHYFTLPHTFFGWEGTDWNSQAINGKAPGQVGGVPVERVVRTGGRENCQVAADGFCDTPADYYSDRISCPFTLRYFDQDSVLVDPDESNFMSYFNDNCVTTFTNEQKNAIVRDFLSRGYDRFPALTNLNVLGAPTILAPNPDAPALYPNAATLTWTSAPGADRYLVTIDRTLNGTFISRTAQFIVQDTFTVLYTLEANREYTWTVQALNAIDVCNNFISSPVRFNTRNWTVGTEELARINSSKLYPNPTREGGSTILEINASAQAQARLSIYNSLGQAILNQRILELNPGLNTEFLDLSSLSAGIYVISIENAQGERINHRLVISE